MAAEVEPMQIDSSAARYSEFFTDEDLPYEENINRNPNDLRPWQRYIDDKLKRKSPPKAIKFLYERALKIFNRSYKLWYAYLKYRRRLIYEKPPTHIAWSYLCDAYERCLVFLNKMPRIWLDYCDIMVRRGLVTETRRVFDRALRALPVTQHNRIWPQYTKFVMSHNIPETTIRVYRRYLKLKPTVREDFVEYLIGIDQLDEAANQLAILVNEDNKASAKGKTTHQLWMELCNLISKNPNKIHTLKADPIIRQGIHRYTDQVGILWLALAEYYTRIPNFERARDIYEEALVSVSTVRDFSQIFDAYSKFAERLVSIKMTALEKAKASETEDKELELELYMTRFEHLIERRPLLLNSVLLRQNPNNVHEWLNRVSLYEGFPVKQIETYEDAVNQIQPKLQTGKLCDLWISYGKFYEKRNELDNARKIFERAIAVNFVKVDDLALVWSEYAEFILRHSGYEETVKLLKRAVASSTRRAHFFDENEAVQHRVYKSLRLWSFYADVEESFGTVESCKAVYEKILDLRIATPQIVVNYAMFLEERNYFEDAFKAYEKGIGLFRWPQVFDIWNVYLTKFIERYGGKKLERARDLFEQCLESCPKKFAKNIYLLYAKLEEKHGLARRAMDIYARATQGVEKEEMHLIYNIYIKRAQELYRMPDSRPIYHLAIENLPEDQSREFSLKFAQMERNLGEIDRARAIYAHCSEICDPRVHGQFWDTWQEFEIKHGNEDTLREMLRVKRSVQATYNTNVNYMSAQMLASIGGKAEMAGELSAADSMAQLEARAQQLAAEEAAAKKGFGSSGDGRIAFVRGESKTTQQNAVENPDEIAIDDIDDDDEEEGSGDEDMEKENGDVIETQAIPDSVFSSLGRKDSETEAA
uniref:Pre-mRNA-splicing factor SYF1 n=1 Tax=Panagrolaimus sp. PS1159 TaxID=55785 RepID=A0AC35G3K7_9BILA